MAKLYGEIASSALMTFDKSFARANGQPLDSTEVYYSLAAAQEYAAGAGAYYHGAPHVLPTPADKSGIALLALKVSCPVGGSAAAAQHDSGTEFFLKKIPYALHLSR